MRTLTAGLFFASSDALEDRLRELALGADPPLHTIVLDFEGVNFIDTQGSKLVAGLVERAPNYGIELRLTRVKVIVMTIYPVHKAQVLAAGADYVLLKGSDYGSLEDVIREVATYDEEITG